ncbi:MAG TPA: DUF6798 domain-containing protein [Polyangiales bacterium]|nr:DUF6798 domain-containing protein [Polyangiales bacterium]
MRARLVTAAWVLAATAWLFVQLGYSFETNDQVQYLLLPYRQIYADFLPGDWFTWRTSHYHVTFAWIVRALHGLCGEGGLRYGVLAAHLANLGLLSYAVLRLARGLGGGLLESSLPLLVFGCARESGLGGAILNHGCLLPSDLALAPFLLACALAIERRTLGAAVWLGISGFLHANYAVLGPLVVGPLALVRRVPKLRELGVALAAYLLLASPSLVLLVSSFLAGDRDPAAVAITLFVRSPHHYDLAYMLPLDFWWAGLLAALALPAFVGPNALPERSARLQLCGLLLLLVAAGVLGTGLHLVSLSRLFTFRMSIPLLIVLWISLAQLGRAAVLRRDYLACLWFVAALAALGLFVRQDVMLLGATDLTDPNPLAPPTVVWAGVLLPLAFATLGQIVPLAKRRAALALTAFLPLVTCIALGLTPLGQTWTGARLRPAHAFHFADRRLALDPPDRDIYAKTRELTPHDARILIAPGLFEFRMRARRSVFVDWKCTPMKGEEASEWKRRMLAAMGTDDFPARGYALPLAADAAYYARPLGDLVALARREGMTHLLVRKTQLRRAMHGAEIVFTSGSFAALRVP